MEDPDSNEPPSHCKVTLSTVTTVVTGRCHGAGLIGKVLHRCGPQLEQPGCLAVQPGCLAAWPGCLAGAGRGLGSRGGGRVTGGCHGAAATAAVMSMSASNRTSSRTFSVPRNAE